MQWLLGSSISENRSYEEALKKINRPHFAASEPIHIIHRALPDSLPLEVKEIIPRSKEGGAFVKYIHKSSNLQENIDIEKAVQEHLQKNPIRPWFNPFQGVQVARVLGRPWVEDLYRIPSQRLRVEFLSTSSDSSATDLTVEALYSLFRPYGKLQDIEPQASDSKISPRYAHVEFSRLRYAVMARNCLHGFTVSEEHGGGKNGTRLKMKYERKIKMSMIKDWLFSHPRIVIPALAALIAAISVTIFDPMRTFSIKMKIKSTLPIEEDDVLHWIRQQISKANIMYFGNRRADPRGLDAIWEDRQGDISQLHSWLQENVETFIVVYGPRGSGKRELVLDKVLKDYKYKVVIDCKQIQDARGDTAKIARAAQQVGYRPVFSSMNSISSFVDLASQGMIGAKAGLSETLDTQLSNIWQSTATALRRVALESRKDNDKDAHLSDDEYLEAHPEQRPVVIIDNYLHNAKENSVVYDKITEWAAGLTTEYIAHVIFLTTEVSFAKPLSKALPNQVLRTIPLGDCSLDVGRRFVLNLLAYESNGEAGQAQPIKDMKELNECIEVLGGRVSDLEFMAHRIEAGETPRGENRHCDFFAFISPLLTTKGAVNRIIEQSSSEILKIFILGSESDAQQHWSREQAWHLIKAIAHSEDGALPYNQVLTSDLFKDNGEAVLLALEQEELISINATNGFPHTVKPGKPVYRTVFKRLAENKALSSRLDLAILSQLMSKENMSIGKYEEELSTLGSLPKYPRELSTRIQWLLDKVYTSQDKIGRYEQESSILQKILKAGN